MKPERESWLEIFAYRTDLEVWMFIVPGDTYRRYNNANGKHSDY